MKRIIILSLALWSYLLTSAYGQTSGEFWVDTFLPGSSNLIDPTINQQALSFLDSLMQDEKIEVTFLGAADHRRWKVNGQTVHVNVSEALDDAKRLGRARVLRERYGRGHIGVTDENIAGVKVIWTKKIDLESYTAILNKLKTNNDKLNTELTKIKSEIATLNPETESTGTTSEIIIKQGASLDWRLQAGLWTWRGSSLGNILSPSLALSIIIDKTALVIQGGVTPWHRSSRFGNEADSFLYAGIKYMRTETYGFSAGGFRGWRFFTDTDNWSLKTTGAAVGVVLTHSFVEFNPTLTYSNVNTLMNGNHWRIGSTLNLNFNFN
ncbi:MAG: hypothetical protein ACE5HO_20235 [bacterium]